MIERDFGLRTAHGPLHGRFSRPAEATALVVLAHLQSTPLDAVVAANLHGRRHALLSMNLLVPREAQYPDAMHNVPLLAQRLIDVLDLLRQDGDAENLPVGLYAGAHVAPAAIRAAARRDRQVQALVCHGGLIDLAGLENLRFLATPLLMLVDADDTASATAYRRAAGHLGAPHELRTLAPGENPGPAVGGWFGTHLPAV